MISQYAPNVKATISLLELLKVKVNKTTVNETLQSHPDWPTLLSISDALSKWHIPNAAGKIEPDKIDQLPTPFIAYMDNREFPLAIVTQVSDKIIEYYSKNYKTPLTDSRNEFLKNWTGIYLFGETTEHSGEADYKENRKTALIRLLPPVFAIITIVSLSFLFLFRNISGIYSSLPSIGIYIQYILLLAGIAVTTLLLWYEIDKNNPLLQKVCTGIVKGNCNAILTGKQAKIFVWLSWSEVGFFYFTGGLLFLFFSSDTKSLAILGWLNVLALPYPIFSIYYQWRVAKQWCVLCIAVQALLVLGAVNVLVNGFLSAFPQLTVSFLFSTGLIYLLPVVLWYLIKPSILLLQEAKNTKREYLRIKFNSEIFETLLKKQISITIPTDGLGIDLGNPTATNTLVKVCNPHCGPCAKAHPEIEKLLEQNNNLKVKIIFTTPNNPNHPSFKPVSHLLAISEHKNPELTKQSLDDWYLADTKDYEIFAEKYPMNGELMKQSSKIEAMDKWCGEMKIMATPTFFINGYQLPEAYSIKDLQYFLTE